jgi:hypothetical protein
MRPQAQWRGSATTTTVTRTLRGWILVALILYYQDSNGTGAIIGFCLSLDYDYEYGDGDGLNESVNFYETNVTITIASRPNSLSVGSAPTVLLPIARPHQSSSPNGTDSCSTR